MDMAILRVGVHEPSEWPVILGRVRRRQPKMPKIDRVMHFKGFPIAILGICLSVPSHFHMPLGELFSRTH